MQTDRVHYRVATYYRTSPIDKEDYEQVRDRMLTWIKENLLSLDEELSDISVRHFVDRKPSQFSEHKQLRELLDLAEKEGIDIIVTPSLDRLVYGKVADLLYVFSTLALSGTRLYLTDDRLTDVPTMVATSATIRRYGRALKSERVKRLEKHENSRGRPAARFDTQKALLMRQQGLKWTEIGKELGYDPSTIAKTLKRRGLI